ncbi:MAG: zinc-ribbon domain-containing protein, partial [bacterium]|nr:zinc-ribbon domain-containing protein [bacterium]
MSESSFNGRTVDVAISSDANSDLEDKTINCIDCSRDFIWTAGEQAFFRDKKLQNPPKRCKQCKQAKNDRLAAIAAAQTSGVRQ